MWIKKEYEHFIRYRYKVISTRDNDEYVDNLARAELAQIMINSLINGTGATDKGIVVR